MKAGWPQIQKSPGYENAGEAMCTRLLGKRVGALGEKRRVLEVSKIIDGRVRIVAPRHRRLREEVGMRTCVIHIGGTLS